GLRGRHQPLRHTPRALAHRPVQPQMVSRLHRGPDRRGGTRSVEDAMAQTEGGSAPNQDPVGNAAIRFPDFQIRQSALGSRPTYGPGYRQLRFVHLQPRPVYGRDERRDAGPPERPDHARPDPGAEPGPDSHFTGAMLAA